MLGNHRIGTAIVIVVSIAYESFRFRCQGSDIRHYFTFSAVPLGSGTANHVVYAMFLFHTLRHGFVHLDHQPSESLGSIATDCLLQFRNFHVRPKMVDRRPMQTAMRRNTKDPHSWTIPLPR